MGPIEYTVVIDPLPEGLDQQNVASKVQEALDQVNQAMSTYLPDSEISKFNASQSTDWIEISDDTASVIRRAIEISQKTEGAFDVTVGPLVDLWKFGKDKSDFLVPSDSNIEATLKVVGFRKLEIAPSRSAIRKLVPGLQIDLSAIAKGYAVDRVSRVLKEMGVESAMVEVGGEVRTIGTKADGEDWKIGVEIPDSEIQRHEKFVKLNGQAMATSGDYRSFHKANGKVYSHSIDPSTGRPVVHQLASISVIADDCMSADAFATAALVMGPTRAQKVLDEIGHAYYMIERDGDSFQDQVSKGFPLASAPLIEDDDVSSQPSVMPMFIGAAVIFGLAILGMAVGAMFNNKPITGSCGGLSAQNGETSCSLCHKPTADCPDLVDGAGETAT